MFEILSHKIAENLKLKELVADFIQAFYSTKSSLGSGSEGWQRLLKLLAQFPGGAKERDEEVLDRYSQPIQKSASVLTAGKFFAFDYTSAKNDNKAYFVMVVASLGGQGTYTNRTTGNTLLTCFLIDSGTNLNTLSIVANVVQERVDPRTRSYQFLSDTKNSRVLFKKNRQRGLSRAGLNTLFPKNKFRTFKLNTSMGNIYEVETNG